MSMMSLILLALCPVMLLAFSIRMMVRHQYHIALLLIAAAIAVGAVGGVKGYYEMDAQAKQATETSFDTTQRESLIHRYQQAVEILDAQSLSHPDEAKLGEAVKFLAVFEDDSLGGKVQKDCPDAKVLLQYAKAMRQAATYNGHMTNQDVNKDEQLLSLVQNLPDNYQGKMADKIVAFRRLVIAMNAEAEKQAKLDAENAAKYQQNLTEGKYGNLRSGDSEDQITAAMGQPDHVNTSHTNEGDLKQYVFRHNSKSIYVYVKNGVVTEVSQ